MTEIPKKILGWLKHHLFNAARYVKIWATDKYITVKDGAAEIVSKYKVPRKHRTDHNTSNSSFLSSGPTPTDTGADTDQMKQMKNRGPPKRKPQDHVTQTNEAMRQGRISNLKTQTSEEVAKRAARNPQVRNDVLQNPGLIDADTEAMADIKIRIANGEDITGHIESHPELSLDAVKANLNMTDLARLGYNQMGNQLADALSDGQSTESGSVSDTADTADTGDAAEAADAVHTAGPTTDVGQYGVNSSGETSGSGFTSAADGAQVGGRGSVSIDTGTGSISSSSNVGSSIGSSSGSSGGATSSGMASSSASTGTGASGTGTGGTGGSGGE